MSVKWNELTGPEIAAMAETTDVAILPFGSLEMHGPHLPTSTDALVAEAVCVGAAQIEPAVVLPRLCYTPAQSMKCYPGTISLSTRTVTAIFEDICDEAARNGFKKIIIFSAHGGCQVTSSLREQWLEKRSKGMVDYSIFCVFIADAIGEENAKAFDGHGGAMETSWAMAAAPELVRIDRVEAPGPIIPPELPGISFSDYWDRQVPYGYKNDPRKADAASGEKMLKSASDFLAKAVKKIKAFRRVPSL
ncbi:MAG: creatininase family protein [Planctomycetota bacterium]|nr:creatininase family protein [Planctomycetota bacterium]